ncbi:hypothetical protein O3P69_005698 [Scylla paramamosain]|uniref:Uncharacterized protein n=1 Tax=Scylla paramamosain TaxID=85552 RepID=A0AAW0U6S3_SCYPA
MSDSGTTSWRGLCELQRLCEKTPVCPTVVIGVLVTSYPEMTLPGWSGVGWGLSGVVLTWSPSLLVLAKTESMKHGRRRSGTIRRKEERILLLYGLDQPQLVTGGSYSIH